jgi:predicted hydrocarbon binding protein
MTNAEMQIPYFGYEIIRGHVLKNILGKEAQQLLYWMGKQVAREYPLETIDAVYDFFQKAGWGNLTLEKQKKDELQFRLEGPFVEARLQHSEETEFRLETGFMARQFEYQNKRITEAFEEIKRRKNYVLITVKWDDQDVTD